jgi:hypothetical protein
MAEKAVIDRWEAEQAVLLVGEEEQQLIVERSALPPGSKEGDWLRVEMQAGSLMSATLDIDETVARRARIAEKLDALRRGDQLQ